MQQQVLLVGAGPMAIEYAKVLDALGREPIVVGRGEASAQNLQNASGIHVALGGIERWLTDNQGIPDTAIIAVNEKELGAATKSVIQSGVRSILVEKPGGLDAADIRAVGIAAAKHRAGVFVAYNRRFYASVAAARQIIDEDGGVTSFNFEFTEWSHVIKDLVKATGVKEQWFLQNSTHVIDLAFYLGGKPEKLSCYTTSGLDWHPASSVFAGAGISDRGALFSYQANWDAPGRWGLEVLTKKHRLIFRPLEKLQLQKLGSVAVEPIALDDELDQKYKPGLYRQVAAFIGGQTSDLCRIEEQIKLLPIYDQMANY